MPKRADFCSVLMPRIYFQSCLFRMKRSRHQMWWMTPDTERLQQAFDMNVRARRLLAEKLNSKEALVEGSDQWDDGDRHFVPPASCRRPPFSLSSGCPCDHREEDEGDYGDVSNISNTTNFAASLSCLSISSNNLGRSTESVHKAARISSRVA